MIETDSYGLISDQLYLVPFLRRYASFLGLDPEEIASRFVRDVQHTESNVVRMSQPLTVARNRRGSMRRFLFAVMLILVVLLLVELVRSRLDRIRGTLGPRATASPVTRSSPIIEPTPAAAIVAPLPEPLPSIAPTPALIPPLSEPAPNITASPPVKPRPGPARKAPVQKKHIEVQ
jgi:cytoskeletal protein RodZ